MMAVFGERRVPEDIFEDENKISGFNVLKIIPAIITFIITGSITVVLFMVDYRTLYLTAEVTVLMTGITLFASIKSISDRFYLLGTGSWMDFLILTLIKKFKRKIYTNRFDEL